MQALVRAIFPRRSASTELDSGYWDDVARRVERKYYLPEIIAELRKDVCYELLKRWCGERVFTDRILKTDVFEEAFADDTALMRLAAVNPRITGVDISPRVVALARRNARQRGLSCRFISTDVRQLPFADGSFDIVFSHSTLDHFPREDDLVVSMSQLRRVLRPGGCVILTLDNRDNLCDPLVKLAARTISPFFVGKSYSVDEVVRAFGSAGFRCAECDYIANSPRIVDIVAVKALELLRSPSIDQLTRRALWGLNSMLSDRPVSRVFGTYVAVKAVRA